MYYAGCQYGKSSDPDNLFTTYFTSNQYIKSKPSSDFIIEKIIVRDDAREYEKRYLKKCYCILGKEKFLKLMINRNLAPGILHDDLERKNISERMKKRWETGNMKEVHKKAVETRSKRTYKKVEFSLEIKRNISERMKSNNPMFNEAIRDKHKRSINSPEALRKKSLLKMENSYNKGKHWYNNGIETKMCLECPEGWVEGRINPHWNYKRKGIK
jgi:hypothetical protein